MQVQLWIKKILKFSEHGVQSLIYLLEGLLNLRDFDNPKWVRDDHSGIGGKNAKRRDGGYAITGHIFTTNLR